MLSPGAQLDLKQKLELRNLSLSPEIMMKLADTGLNSKSNAAAEAVQGQDLLHYNRPEKFLVLARREEKTEWPHLSVE